MTWQAICPEPYHGLCRVVLSRAPYLKVCAEIHLAIAEAAAVIRGGGVPRLAVLGAQRGQLRAQPLALRSRLRVVGPGR